MEYPKHLFKSLGAFGSGNRTYDVAGAANEDEEADLVERGWCLTKEAAWGLETAPEKTLLDGSAKEIEAALPALELEELEALKAAETSGKTRKGVLAALDAAIDAKLAG